MDKQRREMKERENNKVIGKLIKSEVKLNYGKYTALKKCYNINSIIFVFSPRMIAFWKGSGFMATKKSKTIYTAYVARCGPKKKILTN